MVDTARSQSAILTLMADNTTGDISAQDMRDFVVSTTPGHGSFSVTSSAETTISATGAYVKAAGTTTLVSGASNFDMPANNRLRYTGSPDVHVLIDSTISMTCAGNSKIIALKLYHYDDSAASGAVIDSSEVQRKIGTGADIGAAALSGDIVMATNDYLEVHVANLTDTNNATTDLIYLRASGLFE